MKMNKNIAKKLFILLVMTLVVAVANAQPNPDFKPDFNKLNEKRFELIAHELNLDKKTEANVRQIYLEYCKKMGELFKPQSQKHYNRGANKTDHEIDQDIKRHFAHSRKLINIRETYYDKFKKYLTPKQILKIYDIERNEMKRIQEARNDHHRKRK